MRNWRIRLRLQEAIAISDCRISNILD